MRIRTLAVIAAAILLVLACSACKSSDLPPSPASLINGTRDRLNPFRMTLTTDPASPRSGPITIKVHVIDSANQPADGVTLKADVSMNGMGSGDQHLTLDGHGNGDYDGRANLDMAGSWDVNLTASRDGKTQQLKLYIDVGN